MKITNLKKSYILILFLIMSLGAYCQEWDELYSNSKKENNFTDKRNTNNNYTKKIIVLKLNDPNSNLIVNGRNIDEYNKRSYLESKNSSSQNQDYEDYEYTDKIVKLNDTDNAIRITGNGDNISVYVLDDTYLDYYKNRLWNSSYYYGHNRWYYNSWYYPYYYCDWNYGYYNNPWCYPYYWDWFYPYNYSYLGNYYSVPYSSSGRSAYVNNYGSSSRSSSYNSSGRSSSYGSSSRSSSFSSPGRSSSSGSFSRSSMRR